MKLLKVAAAALNQTPLDWDANLRHILEAVDIAQDCGVSVLCLPEQAICGYGCEDMFFSPAIEHTSLDLLEEISEAAKDIVVAVGLPIRFQGILYNAAALIGNQKILGFSAKRHLAADGIHYEPRWFAPWPEDTAAEVKIKSKVYPLGDIVFSLNGIKLGFEICRDAWVENRPGRKLAQAGVDIVLNPSASHFAFNKYDRRKQFVTEGSRDFSAVYIYTNMLGNEAGRAIYDGDALIASCGEIVARGRRFSYQDVVLTAAVVDINANRAIAGKERLRKSSYKIIETPVHLLSPVEKIPAAAAGLEEDSAWEGSSEIHKHEFSRAVSLGLFDYLRKSRSQGFVVSLSGGADSSSVVCLAALMLRFGVKELGLKQLCKKLSHISSLKEASSEKEVLKNVLTCVYQATSNSSKRTREAASKLSLSLGAEFLECSIDGIVESYSNLCEQTVGVKLDWSSHDITLQNIQARARGPLVWMIANLKNALLLATSNRSEAAVGYTTMDGDTCGGLSPIAGIDKEFLMNWLGWVEQGGIAQLGELKELALVTSQEPTAELRPIEAGQRDEDDLMPYAVLDAIERLAIGKKLMPKAVFDELCRTNGEHSKDKLRCWVIRFFELWCRNQWKRERYAPSFHLDDQNLDPKTWCRFPILSGGFERELRELRECS